MDIEEVDAELRKFISPDTSKSKSKFMWWVVAGDQYIFWFFILILTIKIYKIYKIDFKKAQRLKNGYKF